MKKISSVAALFILIGTLLFSGCAKNEMIDCMTFRYGNTITQAMEFFDLTENDIAKKIEDETGTIAYCFQNPSFLDSYGECTFILTDEVFSWMEESYSLGITKITVTFDKKDAMERFLSDQLKQQEKAYVISDEVDELCYGFGDWADVADSPNLDVFETMLQQKYDAKTWQKKLPLVSMERIFEMEQYKDYRIEFSGRTKCIAEYPKDMVVS